MNMFKLFEEFGAITLRDIQPMLNELLALDYLKTEEFQQFVNLKNSLTEDSKILDIYITAIPIDTYQNDKLNSIISLLQSFLERYYEYKDTQFQQVKYKLAQTRFMVGYIQKAVKVNDKIQAKQSSKIMDTSTK